MSSPQSVGGPGAEGHSSGAGVLGELSPFKFFDLCAGFLPIALGARVPLPSGIEHTHPGVRAELNIPPRFGPGLEFNCGSRATHLTRPPLRAFDRAYTPRPIRRQAST